MPFVCRLGGVDPERARFAPGRERVGTVVVDVAMVAPVMAQVPSFPPVAARMPPISMRRLTMAERFGEIAGISYTPLLDSCESHHQRESLFVGVNDPAYGSVMEYRRASEDRWGDMAI